MNILISSLGLYSDIVEEALGLFNFDSFDFYKGHRNEVKVKELRDGLGLSGHGVDEVWLVATDKQPSGGRGTTAYEDFDRLKPTEDRYHVKFRMFILDGVSDITNDIEARGYHDLALKTVAMANRQKGPDGKVFISLACGRKTMSADMQDAAYCFGCDMMFHVLGDNLSDALPLSIGPCTRNEALSNIPVGDLNPSEIIHFSTDDAFLSRVEEEKLRSHYFYTAYYLEKDDRSNFYVLYTLPPSKIERLKSERLGMDINNRNRELEFIRSLPKTDLHCHLGGALSANEMVDVARCYIPDIEAARATNSEYAGWLKDIQTLDFKSEKTRNWKRWYNQLAESLNVHKGLVVAPYLLMFENDVDVLEDLIYGPNLDESKFVGIGIAKYESLGDLQGSALLCHREALRKAVDILIEKCVRENVLYLEVRCSPLNYATENFSASDVMMTILEQLDKAKDKISTSVIIIASRHGEFSKIQQSIELANSMGGNSLFKRYFRGFDLAGNELAAEAKEVREYFLKAMENCHNITIHAGETGDANSIWQAVYYLNAERIGHGLKLLDDSALMNKILERSIGVELCPSSNYQIIGYKDAFVPDSGKCTEYPLRRYMMNELKVSINTDDPGISRTTITDEFYRAARMTEGGLSKWDILQLICNGFRMAFYPYKDKKRLIAEAESSIGSLLNNNQI